MQSVAVELEMSDLEFATKEVLGLGFAGTASEDRTPCGWAFWDCDMLTCRCPSRSGIFA